VARRNERPVLVIAECFVNPDNHQAFEMPLAFSSFFTPAGLALIYFLFASWLAVAAE